MNKSTIVTLLNHDIKTVWNVVNDNKNYAWRSDCERIDVAEDGIHFTEYAPNGFQTNFKITKVIEYQSYEFELSNKNMKGTWTGIFEQVNQQTKLTFTESIQVKNPIMKLFVQAYLKKQQNTYIHDLTKVLESL